MPVGAGAASSIPEAAGSSGRGSSCTKGCTRCPAGNRAPSTAGEHTSISSYHFDFQHAHLTVHMSFVRSPSLPTCSSAVLLAFAVLLADLLFCWQTQCEGVASVSAVRFHLLAEVVRFHLLAHARARNGTAGCLRVHASKLCCFSCCPLCCPSCCALLQPPRAHRLGVPCRCVV